jgi:hypothetical protein
MGKRGRAVVTFTAMTAAVLNAMCGGGSSASAPGPDGGSSGDASGAESGGSSSSGGSRSGAADGGINWVYTPPAHDLDPTRTLTMGGSSGSLRRRRG